METLNYYFDIFFGKSPKVGEDWILRGSRLKDGLFIRVTRRSRFKVFYKFRPTGEEFVKGIYTFRRLYYHNN